MLENKKLGEISKKLIANHVDFMSAFRNNMYLYIDEKDITLSEISEKANIPYATLRTALYGNSRDMNISNVVKLAKVLNVSIDELIGADTIPELSRESLRMCRNLPDSDLYLVRWFIRYLDGLNKDLEPNKRYVSVMNLESDNNGNIKLTSNYEKVDISNLHEPEKSKVFFGIKLNCENYMPHYSPYDVLLVANDRPPKFNEHSLIRIGNFLFISRRTVENELIKYYSIRDGKYRIDENSVDELIGYIVDKI